MRTSEFLGPVGFEWHHIRADVDICLRTTRTSCYSFSIVVYLYPLVMRDLSHECQRITKPACCYGNAPKIWAS